jgi:hypothetical protein
VVEQIPEGILLLEELRSADPRMLGESQLMVSVDLWTALEREPARRALAKAVGRAVKKDPAAAALGRLLLRHFASRVPQGQRFLA